MAITLVGVNNAAGQNAGTGGGSATTAITPTLPTGTAVGDRVFVVQCYASLALSPAAPSGWTVAGTKDTVIGTGAVASSAGQRYMSIYYRDYDGVWTMPSFALVSSSNNSHWIGVVAIRKGAEWNTWDTPTISAKAEYFPGTPGTAFSATTASSFTTHSGGLAVIGSVQNDLVTSTGGTLTQTGATFGTVTEGCDGGTATGNDVSGTLHTCLVTTGATATVTFAKTLSAASQGGTLVIEQTETVNPQPPGVAFDAIGAGAAVTTSPISWTHTASGTDRAVVVAVGWRGSGGTVTSATATYDGVPMTQLASLPTPGFAQHLCFFGLLDPPTGAKTVSVSVVATGTTNLNGNSASYTTVDSFGTAVTAGSSAGPWTISATAAVGDKIVNSFAGTGPSAYDQTVRWLSTTGLGTILGDAPGTGSPTTFNATMVLNWAAVAVPLIQVGGTPPPPDNTGQFFAMF